MYTGSNNVVPARVPLSLAGKDTGAVTGGYSRKYNSFKNQTKNLAVTNVYHIPKFLKIENERMGYKANIHLLYHDSWVKFKVFVLNNKNMTVSGSMSCHNITAFRIHPILCFPVLRNTKSAGLKIFWHFWYAKHVYYAYLWVNHPQILWGFNCSTSYSLK